MTVRGSEGEDVVTARTAVATRGVGSCAPLFAEVSDEDPRRAAGILAAMRLTSSLHTFAAAALAASLFGSLAPLAGCQLVAGLGGEEPLAGGSGGAGGGGGGTTTTGGTTATGGGGAGGGAGGGSACNEGDEQPCYTGPDGTLNVGLCKGGSRTCGANGVFGPCEGEVTPAAEVCSTAADESCDGANCGDVIWARQLTGASFVNVAFDLASGELITVGSFQGKIGEGANELTSAGGRDAFIVKWSSFGEILWARSFGDTATQSFGAVTVGTAGNIYVGFTNLGTLVADSFTTTSVTGVIKFDPQGTASWLTETGGEGGGALVKAGIGAIRLATDGDVLAHARFLGTMQIGPETFMKSDQDGVVMKLNGATGAPLWAFQYGTSTSDGAGSISPAPAGGVYLTGTVDGAVNVPGGQIVSGMSATDTDGFVARFGAGGAMLWGQAFGSAQGFQAGRKLASDLDGNVVVAGSFDGQFAFSGGGSNLVADADYALFAAKLDQGGTHLWSGAIDGPGTLSPFNPSALAGGPGHVVAVGELEGSLTFGDTTLTSDGSADGFVAKIDGATGATIWARKIGGAAYQVVDSVSVDASGRVAIGGEFEGAIVLGDDSFVTPGGTVDPFIAVLAP